MPGCNSCAEREACTGFFEWHPEAAAMALASAMSVTRFLISSLAAADFGSDGHALGAVQIVYGPDGSEGIPR